MVFGLQRYTLFFITENIILIIIVIDCFTNKYFFTRGGNLRNIFFFTIVVVVENLDPDSEDVTKVADSIERALEERGIDVIVDDRAERPGVKFKDADLIGFTVRVVVGAKGLANGGVEVKRRDEDKSKTRIVPAAEAVAAVNPIYFDVLPLSLEEIFIYELGGVNYEVKNIVL